LWEAVTMYLDREAVESTLRKIASTASGSVVAFDYFNADLIEARSLYMRYARAVVNTIGEPFRFGIESTKPSSKHVAAFLFIKGGLIISCVSLSPLLSYCWSPTHTTMPAQPLDAGYAQDVEYIHVLYYCH
jgi:hypothetical protein